MNLDAFLARVRRQARAASSLASKLDLERSDRVVNVHTHGWRAYEAFMRRFYGDGEPRIMAISMNPGPHGAVQTGIPFCDMGMARQLLPDIDGLVRRPSWLVSERREASGRQLWAWAETDLGSARALYGAILFPMTLPLGILRMPRRLNVPIPALPRRAQRQIEGFLERHAADEIRLAAPRGVLLLGDYACRVWEIAVRVDRELDGIPHVRVPHPAARMGNREKHAAWTKGFRQLGGPLRACDATQRIASAISRGTSSWRK